MNCVENDARLYNHALLVSAVVYTSNAILGFSVASLPQARVQLYTFTSVYQNATNSLFVPGTPQRGFELNGFDLFVWCNLVAAITTVVFYTYKPARIYRPYTEGVACALLAAGVYVSLGGINQLIFFTGAVLAGVATALSFSTRSILGTPLVFGSYVFVLLLILSQTSDTTGPENTIRAIIALFYGIFMFASAGIAQIDARPDITQIVYLASKTALTWQAYTIFHKYCKIEDTKVSIKDLLFVSTIIPFSLLAGYLFFRFKKDETKEIIEISNIYQGGQSLKMQKPREKKKKHRETYAITFSV